MTGRCFWRLTDPLLKLMGGSMQMRFHCERALDREGQLMLQMAELWVARDVSNLRVVWHRRQHNAQPFDVANVAGVRGGDRGGLNCEGCSPAAEEIPPAEEMTRGGLDGAFQSALKIASSARTYTRTGSARRPTGHCLPQGHLGLG